MPYTTMPNANVRVRRGRRPPSKPVEAPSPKPRVRAARRPPASTERPPKPKVRRKPPSLPEETVEPRLVRATEASCQHYTNPYRGPGFLVHQSPYLLLRKPGEQPPCGYIVASFHVQPVVRLVAVLATIPAELPVGATLRSDGAVIVEGPALADAIWLYDVPIKRVVEVE